MWSSSDSSVFDLRGVASPNHAAEMTAHRSPITSDEDVMALLLSLSASEQPKNRTCDPPSREEDSLRSMPTNSASDGEPEEIGERGGGPAEGQLYRTGAPASPRVESTTDAAGGTGEPILSSAACTGTMQLSPSVNMLSGSSSTLASAEDPAAPTTPPQRNRSAACHAFANISSGLSEKNFNVLTPDKKMMLSIPSEYVIPTAGSRNYRNRNRTKLLFSFCLCKTFASGSTCYHGSDCDFIHCDPEQLMKLSKQSTNALSTAAAAAAVGSGGAKGDPATSSGEVNAEAVQSFQVHWSTPVTCIEQAPYARLRPGHVVYVRGGSGHPSSGGHHGGDRGAASDRSPQALPSDMVYETVGGREALRLTSSVPLRVCKHYEREKCARGALCHFIHPVAVAPKPPTSREGRGADAARAAALAPPQSPASMLAPEHVQLLQRQAKMMASGSLTSLGSAASTMSPPQTFTPADGPSIIIPRMTAEREEAINRLQESRAQPPMSLPSPLTTGLLPPGALLQYGDKMYMVTAPQQVVPLQAKLTPSIPSDQGGVKAVIMSSDVVGDNLLRQPVYYANNGVATLLPPPSTTTMVAAPGTPPYMPYTAAQGGLVYAEPRNTFAAHQIATSSPGSPNAASFTGQTTTAPSIIYPYSQMYCC